MLNSSLGFTVYLDSGEIINEVTGLNLECYSADLIELDSGSTRLSLPSVQIIASAHYMLSELFQLDEPPGDEDGGESLRAGGSEDSYSDEDREEEEEEDLTEDSDEDGCYGACSSPQVDSKAVAVIRSVRELSVPEKYKSTHQIRVSAPLIPLALSPV